MTSTSIYTAFVPDQYCVYHTTYSGSLMPANYIGSTYVDRILIQNYHGSVASDRYRAIWKSEIKLHPELFKTVIVSYHDTRSNATCKERQIQKTLNVVKSDLFINRSYASINGFGDTTYTPEELTTRNKKISDTSTIAHANRTPEEKVATSKKISDAHANRTPEEKAARIKKISDTKANKSPEEKAATNKKHSEAQILYNANKSPEEKAATNKKRLDTIANKSPEEKAAKIKKRKDTLKERSIINPSKIPFLSIIHNQKSYAKNIISRLFPEFKQFY